ncbi:MAG: biotin/lipoyl-binding protein [Niabella sp.]
MKRKMKTSQYITSSVIIATMLLACNQQPNDSTRHPEGKVKFESISVAPKIAGRIATIKVSEGQTVQKGDTLAIIDVPEIASKLQQAEGAITSAEGQLQLANNGATTDQLMQVQGQLDAAVAQLDFAEQSYKRMHNMFTDSLIPAQQYDEVKSKYLAAKAQVTAIKAKQQEIKSGTRPEVIRSAKGQVARAVGARNEVLQAQKERYIIAPENMTIENIALQEGELATPGYTIFSGYLTQKTFFRFTIGEKAINAYQVGNEVTISVPNTSKNIKANIAAVKQLPRYADNTSTAPNRQVGEGFYELKIVPVNPQDADGLYNNSTVFIKMK